MASSGDHGMRDEDRLPWLETVDDDYQDGPSILRILLLVALGLAVIAAAIFGYYYWEKRRASDGNGELIVAQEGDYKVKPDDPGGLKVEGEGETAIATSDGSAPGNASINVEAIPEAPVTGTKAGDASGVTGGTSKTEAAVPVSAGG